MTTPHTYRPAHYPPEVLAAMRRPIVFTGSEGNEVSNCTISDEPYGIGALGEMQCHDDEPEPFQDESRRFASGLLVALCIVCGIALLALGAHLWARFA